jgi:DNA-binding CsgD family transcriptional regulator
MAASGLLRERDLRALTAVIEDGLRDDPGPAMPWAVFEQLQQLIPADTIQLHEFDVQCGERIFQQFMDHGGGRDIERGNDGEYRDAQYWQLRHSFLPCSYSARTGDVTTVTRWSDFCTVPELKRTPFYADYLAPWGAINHAILLPFAAGPGRTRYLWLARLRRDFSERDRLALQLLRPHLQEVYLDAERRRHGIPHLSRREREVLQLVAQGSSNADIARILFISPATVAKHMEHIFDRTGVRTRSAAAALVLPQIRPPTQPPRQTGR